MNCQECRKHLHPYLDSEIEVRDNLAILEHLNACAPCQRLFASEERCWARVRAAFRFPGSPRTLFARLPEILVRENRVLFWRRLALIATPMAAAAAVFFAVVLPDPARPVVPVAPSHARHSIRDHGAGIEFSVTQFLGLTEEAEARQRPTLDPEILKSRSETYEELEGEGVQRFYLQLFGPDAKLPSEILAPRVQAAALQVGFRGTPVSNMILDLQDRRIGVYRLTREQAELMDLHVVDDGVQTGLRIERCRGCHVIAITRGDRVYILVSKEGVEPLIQLVRQTF